MKLLVCISKTPETTAKISFKDNDSVFNEEGVQFIMNPYDEWYALVRAIELKEQVGGTVTVINVGDASNDVVIRKALAIGADDAVRIDTEASGSFHVASQIANHAKTQSYDIIFLGKETIDYNGAEMGAILSEMLSLPYVSFASKLEIEANTATLERDIEGGVEIVEIETPFVVSAAKGMAEQRIPNMRGIMMAKRKPLEVVEGTSTQTNTRIKSFSLPSEKDGVKMIEADNMDELVRLLNEEAKVL